MKQNLFLTVKDHSVSGEKFELIHNDELQMLETYPQPSTEKLPEYYQSEDYISHTDSKRNLFENAYHFIRSIALNKKLKLINAFNTSSKTLLDVGCGTGDFLLKAKENDWKVTGIEPNENARAITAEKIGPSAFDVEHLAKLEPSSFDVITLWHVLEHLPNLEMHVAVFERLLKEDGRLVIAVPNFNSYDAKYYNEFWAAYDVPRHLWHFSQKSIQILFSKVNMTVEKVRPMKFDSFYVSLLSEKYKNGKMNFFKAFVTGLRSNLKAKSSGEYSSLIYVLKKSN
ncbi:methyltransferase domain-containing protein [Winogradskyella sp. 3972H.M.0a.05]|uniref:class I SAM-dependent methyltransferase n=1 Tax=Winogradskyella sp. 3972H.M.0a.05 TaxID=2950277 RepID=UPI003392157B